MIETIRTAGLLHRLRRLDGRPGEVERLQARLLPETVAHAYARVLLYRRLWDDAGVDVDRVRRPEDLARLPVVRRELLRGAAGEALTSDLDRGHVASYRTSGSSGEPLEVVRGPVEQRVWRAVGLRIWLEHGFRWRDVTLRFDSQAAPGHALQRLGLSRVVWVSNRLPLAERVERLRRVRPDVVVGTPTVLRRVAEALSSEAGSVRPKVVFSQGEVLDAGCSELVRRVLGSDPVDLYGLTEVGYLAWQCRQRSGFHLNPDAYLVELLRDGRPAAPGELGRVVVTDLRGRTMPMIRYETGDLAVAGDSPCACGRPLPLLASVEGRERGALAGPAGPVTTRRIVDALGAVASPAEFRLDAQAPFSIRLELAPPVSERLALAALRPLVGEIPITVAPLDAPLGNGAEKTQPVSSSIGLTLP